MHRLWLVGFTMLRCSAFATRFFFTGNDDMEYVENWVEDRIPCVGDRVRFDEGKVLVTLLGERIDVREMELPNNGILFFDANTAIGEKGKWQCDKRTDPQDAFFITESALSFYNASNWIVSEEGTNQYRLLHALQIPSDQDDAVFPVAQASKILIDDFVTVYSLYYSDEKVNWKKFDTSTLWTLEGQFQFVLAPTLKTDIVLYGIQYQWPKFMNTVSIVSSNKDFNAPATSVDPAGKFNSNAEPNKMSVICAYQTCKSVEGVCSNSFQPVGHCCRICGSMLRFRSPNLDFERMKEKLRVFKEESSFVQMFHLAIDFMRIDHAELAPQYQIVVIGPDSMPFDERVFDEIIDQVRDQIVKGSVELSNAMSIFEVLTTYSLSSRTSLIGDIFLVLFIVLVIAALALGTVFLFKRNEAHPTFARLFFASRVAARSLAVRWSRWKAAGEDYLELIDESNSVVDTQQSPTTSRGIAEAERPEFHETLGFSNILFCEASTSGDVKHRKLEDSNL